MKQKIWKSIKRLSFSSWILLALVTSAVLGCGFIAAKYVFRQEKESLYAAKNFYFESDYLKESGDVCPQYILQKGQNSICFDLKNYPDELRYAEVDIVYEVKMEKEGTQAGEASGTLNGMEQTAAAVEFTDLAPGVYHVTASAIRPYTAELEAQFTVQGGSDEVNKKVLDSSGSPVLQVIISTQEYAGNVIISWPQGVYPDTSDPLLQNAQGNSHEVTMKEYSEYVFLVYKADIDQVYTENISVSPVEP